MNRKLTSFFIVLAIISGIIACMYMMSREDKVDISNENIENEIQLSEKVEDECTDEYEVMRLQDIAKANAEEEKISPNAIITWEKFYMGCEHTISRYEEATEDIVNLNQEDLQEKYKVWNIAKFSADSVVLHKDFEGQCGEHYMLRDVNGKINIYELGENGEESLLEETEISTEYLTETDMINMENGLIVYGKESLNKLLEDYE